MERIFYQPELTDFLQAQLTAWPEANARYADLARTGRRAIATDSMPIFLQHNPARIVSTGAKTDAASVRERKCFLCPENRPALQDTIEIEKGWDMLVNPYPIFPFHFTIASRTHQPQNHIPAEMAIFAERLPGMVVFYNGAKAGASAPDHLHCQAVPQSELPIVSFTQQQHKSQKSEIRLSCSFSSQAPFTFLSAVIRDDADGLRVMRTMLHVAGASSEEAEADPDLVNAFCWVDPEGLLRMVVIPRRAHRPAAFFLEGNDKITVSPGSVDMAGIIITPVEKDFRRLTSHDVALIFKQTAFVDCPPEIHICP